MLPLLWLAAGGSVFAGTSGCAVFQRNGAQGEAPAGEDAATGSEAETAGGRETERVGVAAPGDRRLPERGDTGAASPKRQASQRLVEEGKGFAIVGREREARERFEAALRVDGSNGEAYLELARLAADQGDWDEAEAFHDRAGTLLEGRPEWRGPLDDLARRIAERR